MSDLGASIGGVAELVLAHFAGVRCAGPKLIAITGSVAVGKSTFANALCAELVRTTGQRGEVVATDGFLRSEPELSQVGLLERKGFPESYDAARFSAFLAEVARGAARLLVPMYSHLTRSADVPREVVLPDWLLIEGVYAVQPIWEAGLPAYSIFVAAAADDVRAWYFARRRVLRGVAADHDALDVLAQRAWDFTNVPNFEQHIGPQRKWVDLVVEKAADHALVRCVRRPADLEG
jgi:type I pantothenate kinase